MPIMGKPPDFCKAEYWGAFWFELLVAELKPLAVVDQDFHGRRSPVAFRSPRFFSE